MKSVLAIIPARAGSKGVPNKNIKDLCGKPLIAYTIECALNAKLISRIIVSTDSEEIASIASNYGINVPTLRPPELSNDTALTIDVISYEVKNLKAQHQEFDYVMLLQPTVPLRSSSDVDLAIQSLIDSDCNTLISVADVGGNHPLRMKSIRGNKLANYIDTGIEDMRPRHLLPKVYIRDGSIYLKETELLLQDNSFGSPKTLPFVTDQEYAVNIDTPLDFLMAELLLKDP